MSYQLKIKQVKYPAADAVSLYFDKVDGFANYLPGQHLALTATVEGQKITRNYSFNTSPYLDKDIAITVRSVPGGKMSAYLMRYAHVGMELEAEGPLGNFTLQPNPQAKRHLIMFAGGSGITPLMSMIRSVLYREPGSVISLIYANRSFERIIFYQELQDLQKEFHQRFKVYDTLSDASHLPAQAYVFFKGELNRLVVRKMVKNLQAEIPLPAEFYLCGPFGYMALIEETLALLNIPKDKIFKEHFFIPKQPEADHLDFSSLPERKVVVDWQGSKYHVPVPSGKSILEGAFKVGLNLPYSCKEGQCGTCRSLLLSGEVRMKRNHILTSDELEEGQVLLCQGYAMTEGVLVKPLHQNNKNV